jgi:uncharacterized protein DUF3147
MGELVLRFVIGGTIVSLFALLGEVFKPKTFAGTFGAAPSVSIASLAIAFAHHDREYVAAELTTMLVGSVALAFYSAACIAVAERREVPVWLGAGMAWLVWGLLALSGWWAAHVVGVA